MRNWLKTVKLILTLELKLRIRTTKWWIILGIWFLFIAGIFFLMLKELNESDDRRSIFPSLYCILFVVSVFAAPAYSATAINGDRKDATLAILQATPVSSLQITLGKLLSSWLATLSLTLVSLPFLLWSYCYTKTATWYQLILGLTGHLLTLLLICSIGIYFSAKLNRPIGSTMLTYLTTFTLILISPLLFWVLTPRPQVDFPYPVYASTKNNTTFCSIEHRQKEIEHTEKTWWLLAINPIATISDAFSHDYHSYEKSQNDSTKTVKINYNPAFSDLSETISEAKDGSDYTFLEHTNYHFSPNECLVFWDNGNTTGTYYSGIENVSIKKPINYHHYANLWPLGFICLLTITSLNIYLTARRLKIPTGKLGNNIRIA